MRSAILLLVLSAAILGSCTSAYKTGQTPDDVYYSPERQHDEYVRVKENNDQYYNYNYDDQYLRMKVHNRMMWSELDDPYFYNPAYSYSYNNWNTPWNFYTSWNYYYNPYCSPVVYYTPKTVIAYNHPRVFNMNAYTGTPVNSSSYNPKGGSFTPYNNYSSKPVRIVGYTPSSGNSGSGAGNFLRNIFNSSSNNSSGSSNNSSFSSGSRSSGGSSGGSGSSGGGGGSAPVRRF